MKAKKYSDTDIYALYQGEQVLGTGTILELAKARHVKPETIAFYGYSAYAHRTSENAKRLVKLDGDD